MNEQTIVYLAAVVKWNKISIVRVERRGKPGAMREVGSWPTDTSFPNTPAGRRRAYDHIASQNARLAAA